MVTGPITVGAVAVDVVPSAKNFLSRLMGEIGKDAAKAGRDSADGYAEGFEKQAKPKVEKAVKSAVGSVGKQVASDGEEAGDEWSSAFARQIRSTMQRAVGALPKLDIEVDDSDLETIPARIAVLREALEEVAQFDFSPDVDTDEFLADVALIRTAMAGLLNDQDTNLKVRADVSEGLSAVDSLTDRLNRVNTSSGQFARTLNTSLRNALSNLPDPEIDLQFDDADVVDRIDGIRNELTALSRERVGVDIDSSEAMRRVELIRTRLEELSDEELDPRVALDIAAALANITTLATAWQGAKRTLEEPVEITLRRGAFADELSDIEARVKASVAAMRDFGQKGEGLAGFEAEFDKVRREFERFVGDLTLTPDVDLGPMIRQLQEYRIAFAAAASDEDLTQQTRVNAQRTGAELDRLLKRLRDLNGESVDVDFARTEVNAGRAARTIQSTLGEVLRNLPDPYVTVTDNSPQAQARYEELLALLREMDGKRVGIDIPTADAEAALRRIRVLLAELVDRKDIAVDIDVVGEDELARLDTTLARLDDARRVTVDADTGPAERHVSGFERQLEAALRTMKALLVDGLDLDFDVVGNGRVELAEIQSAIEILGDAELGVDFDTGEAIAEGSALLAVLKTIASMTDVDVTIKARVVEAIAAMDAVIAKRDEIRDKTFTVKAEDKTEVEVDENALKRQLGGLSREIVKVIDAALADIGENIDESLPGGARLAELRTYLVDLRSATLDTTFGGDESLHRLKLINAEVHKLRDQGADPNLLPNISSVGKRLDEAVPGLQRFGQETRKLTGFAKQLDDLLGDLMGKINSGEIRDQTGNVINRELLNMRSRFGQMRVDLQAGLDPTALYAEVRAAGLRAEQLAPTVEFDTGLKNEFLGTGREIRSFAANLSEVSDKTAEVAKNAIDAKGGFLQIASVVNNLRIVAIFALLPILISAAVVAIGALIGILLSLGAIVASVLGGIGVAVLAFGGITKAIQERKNVAKQAAQQAAQDASKELSDSIARRNAAEAITDAEKALAKARKRVSKEAEDVVKAEKRVKEARQEVKDATVTARQALVKLNEDIRKNRIEQEAATATVLQAQEAYNRLLADPTASYSDLIAAQAKYNKAEQDIRDLQVEQNENLAERAKYDRDGLLANSTYKSAVDGLTSAQESLISQQESLADAREGVVDAEQAVTRAKQAQLDLIAQQVLQERALAEQRKAQTEEYDKLTDTGKKFVDFWIDVVEPFFDELAGAAQDSGLLEGIASFFEALISQKEPIKNLISSLGGALGNFFAKLGEFIASKEGKDFIDFLAKNLPKGIEVLTGLIEPLGNALLRIFTALAPHLDKLVPVFAETLVTVFEKLGEFLESEKFAAFVDQMVADMPRFVEMVGGFLLLLLNLALALGKYSQNIIDVLNKVLEVVNGIPADWLVAIGEFLTKLGLTALIVSGGGFFLILIGLIYGLTRAFDEAKEAGESFREFFDNLPTKLSRAFAEIRTLIEQVWAGKIPSLLEQPVTRLRTVLNGLITAINWVGGPFGLHIEPIGEIQFGYDRAKDTGAPLGGVAGVRPYADGGVVPGYAPKRDIVPALLSPGEGVLVPEATLQIGSATILEWNRRARAGQRIQGFEAGGIVGEVVGALPGGSSLVASAIAYMTSAIAGPLRDLANGPGAGTAWNQALGRVPGVIIEHVGAWMLTHLGDALPGASAVPDGTAGVGLTVLDLLRQRGSWYDSGGYLPPGVTLAVNGTGRPERVLTEEQWRAMQAQRRDGQVGVTVRVVDGAVPGLVTAEVDRQFGDLADAQIYGGA